MLPATPIARSIDIVGDDNFPQGCAFSPDGLCVLTSTAADHRLRLYNTPPLKDLSSDRAEADPGSDYPNQPQPYPDPNAKPNNALHLKHALHFEMGESVRSYSWYPHMNSADPSTCAFLAASRDKPIHLIDAYTARVRATYRPYNALDEMESPNVVAFAPDGQRIFAAGFRSDRMIHVFRTELPGRDSDVLRLGKTKRSKDGQKGIASAIAFPHQSMGASGFVGPSVFAVGCYSPGSIYIYDDRMPSDDSPAGTILHGGLCVVGHGKGFMKKKRRFGAANDSEGGCSEKSDTDTDRDIFSAAKVRWYQSRARGGVTQLSWSPTGDCLLYSASRRSDAVLAWDLRMLSGDLSRPIRGLAAYGRDGDTNQRLEFDFDEHGERLFVGCKNGCVKVYDVQSGKMTDSIEGFDDAVSGVSFYPTSAWGMKDATSSGLLAVGVGARRFDAVLEDTSDGDENSAAPGANTRAVAEKTGSIELYKV